MDLLEKLYGIAEKNLTATHLDWPQFSVDFEEVFNAKMTLYRSDSEAESQDLVKRKEVITTNSLEQMEDYFRDKVYESHGLVQYIADQFEPIRRTDRISDDELRQHPFYKSFLRPNNTFYLMVVHAVLPDESSLVQFIWRAETQSDFSDKEKLRMALFMRMLARIVGQLKIKPMSEPSSDVEAFGEKHALTKAETGILGELLEGQSLRQIAEQSGRSYGTIRWHVHNLLGKCEVKTQKSLLYEFYRLIKH